MESAQTARIRRNQTAVDAPALLRAIRKAIAEADAEQAVEEVSFMLKPEVREPVFRNLKGDLIGRPRPPP